MTTMRIGVTGSEGLIGSVLCAALERAGHEARRFDVRNDTRTPHYGDVREPELVAHFVEGCDGVVHLGAVSRVILGEREPERCVATNEVGTRNVLDAAVAASSKPWVIFASSREVYGESQKLPVHEDAALSPVNIYGRTKAAAERATVEARARGINTAVLRFSNVYGATRDHADRVVPAFCRGAALGHPLRVDGSLHTFDFTHLDDTLAGVLKAIEVMASGERNLPPIHLLTGRPTTLGQLAVMAAAAGGWRSEIHEAPSRSFDVGRFVGDPARARELLGWEAKRSLDEGVRTFVRDFAREHGTLEELPG
jgi:nucleoside-diphosphate-sugar epimerase